MAAEVNMGGNSELFVGEDKVYSLELLDDNDVPVDMTGWTVTFVAQKKNGTTLLTKTPTISGTYNADRDDNTQRAVLALTDTDLALSPGVHRQSWKRTDDGSEAILLFGLFILEKTTQT